MNNIFHGNDDDCANEDAVGFQKISLRSPFSKKKNIFKNVQTFFKSKSKHLHIDNDLTNKDHLTLNKSPLLTKYRSNEIDIPSPNIKQFGHRDELDESKDDDLVLSMHFASQTLQSPTRNSSRRSLTNTRENDLLSRIKYPGSPQTSSSFSRSRSLSRKASMNSSSNSSRRVQRQDGKVPRSSRKSSQRFSHISQNNLNFTSASSSPLAPNSTGLKCFESCLAKAQIPYYYDDRNSNDFFPRISPETLKNILQNNMCHPFYSSCCIIDCRFEYEYVGGHIINSVNVHSRDDIENEFIHKVLHSDTSNNNNLPTLLIIHCEFSSHRGPSLASHLRNCDRIINQDHYPKLFYPDILILDGGYKAVFDNFPELCYPRQYVGMNSQENLLNCEQEMDKFRRESKRFATKNNSFKKLASPSNPNFFYRDSHQSSTTMASSALSFKFEPPPKLSLNHRRISSGSSLNLSESTGDENFFPILSKSSMSSNSNLSTSHMLLMDGLDTPSCFSFEDERGNDERGSKDEEQDGDFTFVASDREDLPRPARRSLFSSLEDEDKN
ncbi:AHL_G0041020.mRNA.1.CDS.1 [Saccharomyces cerevisiae]|uniref:M-phase inducer phosphatase n=1 Tax=Saccharomyces paradoxus TaxID=27291 RepID=A0A8B8UX55_SACPA|nr:Mih1 [Saccharomyces paradoxus]AJP40741.1 Mih1p [Saccharomyces cerevisiae YJM1078]AJS81129.1 Mih1p [Saccharomyces cerevisiae YJM1252]CAI4895242.1 AHL_G0041020.mRNA.1.CDS.1 [Saccharomyces cerevisiae]QHS75315.1 Mih1 [Saccharomyces paradoxus]CAI6837402.1 AHL_G0041020.mRNA.1.CDS.1 [Saccharomyces cerevisiae]